MVLKTKTGDAESYGKIYDRYFEDIYTYVYFRTSHQETAEDIAAEAFFRVWEYIKGGKRVKNARAFLYETARNLTADYHRKKKPVSLEQEMKETIPSSEENPYEITASRDERRLLYNALSKMREEYKEAVTLRYIHGLSYKEMADVLGKHRGAVRILVFRGLKELKKILWEVHFNS
ncbi:MAG: RNA polymerase sigma factor [Candidatus Jacksonbacteria bacterium]|nr:RNA polymerase sigma factor [Candidatus Jacksonbacteria bacterium]